MSMQPGTYKIQATIPNQIVFGRAGTGTKQVGVVVEVTDERGDVGRQFTWYGFFNNEKNSRRTLESLKYLGWDGTPFEQDEEGNAVVHGLGTKEANGVFSVETDNEGNATFRLSFINDPNRAGVAMADRIEGAELSEFFESMSGLAASVAADIKGGPEPKAKTPPAKSANPAAAKPAAEKPAEQETSKKKKAGF